MLINKVLRALREPGSMPLELAQMTAIRTFRRVEKKLTTLKRFELEMPKTLDLSTTEIQAEFKKLGPWYTDYEVRGVKTGGKGNYLYCSRMQDLVRWHQNGGRALDLGSFEGMHSLLLAQLPGVTEVVGLEGRDFNVARAEFMRKMVKRDNVRFEVANLENVDLAKQGRFDLIFCAGLLYHLKEPWKLVAQMGKVTDRLFLSTHFSVSRPVVRNGYSGKMYGEFGFADGLSGLEAESFWPTLSELKRMLHEVGGFKVVHTHHIPDYLNAPLVNLYCEK